MPRRKAAIKRETIPDPLYGSDQIARLVNVIMRAGKKSIAERIVYDALGMLVERLQKEHKDEDDSGKGGKSAGNAKAKTPVKSTHATGSNTGKDGVVEGLRKALGNIAPTVEVKSRRVGGATYQVPIEVAADRGIALAMRWLVQAAKKRSEKTMALRLAAEMHEACQGRGASVKTRDDVHRMAKANQAFAHYRW
jgi:small subunit ribosomal protein S7